MLSASGAVRHDHVRSAWLGVVGVKTFIVYSRDRHRIYTIRISVEVALIAVRSTISTRKHEDGSFATAPVVDAIDNSLFNETGGTFHGHAVIRRAPAATVDGDILEAVVQGSGLVNIGDGS